MRSCEFSPTFADPSFVPGFEQNPRYQFSRRRCLRPTSPARPSARPDPGPFFELVGLELGFFARFQL